MTIVLLTLLIHLMISVDYALSGFYYATLEYVPIILFAL